jgi:hypothetical protein
MRTDAIYSTQEGVPVDKRGQNTLKYDFLRHAVASLLAEVVATTREPDVPGQ